MDFTEENSESKSVHKKYIKIQDLQPPIPVSHQRLDVPNWELIGSMIFFCWGHVDTVKQHMDPGSLFFDSFQAKGLLCAGPSIAILCQERT